MPDADHLLMLFREYNCPRSCQRSPKQPEYGEGSVVKPVWNPRDALSGRSISRDPAHTTSPKSWLMRKREKSFRPRLNRPATKQKRPLPTKNVKFEVENAENSGCAAVLC